MMCEERFVPSEMPNSDVMSQVAAISQRLKSVAIA